VWQLGPLLLLLVLVPFPLLLSHYVHQCRVAEPDLASALTGAFSPERHSWLATMLYQRFVLALIASVAWRGLLLAAVSICNLALALHFRPFRTRSAQGIYVTLQTMLVVIALFALPSLDRKSLATSHQFGNHLFMEWLQFILVLSALPVIVLSLLAVEARVVASFGLTAVSKVTNAVLLFKTHCHERYLCWRGNSSLCRSSVGLLSSCGDPDRATGAPSTP